MASRRTPLCCMGSRYLGRRQNKGEVRTTMIRASVRRDRMRNGCIQDVYVLLTDCKGPLTVAFSLPFSTLLSFHTHLVPTTHTATGRGSTGVAFLLLSAKRALNRVQDLGAAPLDVCLSQPQQPMEVLPLRFAQPVVSVFDNSLTAARGASIAADGFCMIPRVSPLTPPQIQQSHIVREDHAIGRNQPRRRIRKGHTMASSAARAPHPPPRSLRAAYIQGWERKW